MKAAVLIVQCLENEGVEYIFVVPGEENMDVLDALISSSICFAMTRHEQGAASMMDVYGRLTGKAGVCLSTLGPGATNLITGVADANMDCAPLVALTGQVDQDRLHKESHQHLDIVSLFRPETKWNTTLPIPDIIPEVFRKAFKLAQSEKPGAIGFQTLDYVNCEFLEADVVIAIRYDIVEFAPHTWNHNRDKNIVHVDMSPAEVDASYIVKVGVGGEIAPHLVHAEVKHFPESEYEEARQWLRGAATLANA